MKFFKKLIKTKWIQHLVFWVLSVYVIGSYFSISSIFLFIDFIYALVFHIPLALLVYLNLNWAIPKYLERGRYFKFLGTSVSIIGLAFVSHELIFEFVIPLIPSIYMVSFLDYGVLMAIFLIYFVMTTLFKLANSWYNLQSVEREKLNIELNALKSQINPHFLFNSLNSIYSLSLKQDQRTPEVILELSGLMRYILYEAGDDRVLLTKEIEMMQSYIDLQQLRADQSASISFEIKGDPSDILIAPLLFLPLIENSFKHGVKGTSTEAYVDMELRIKSYEVVFKIKNNKGTVDDVEAGKFGGIGLENVRKRLNLIYPDSKMSVEETENEFAVTVELDI